MKGKIVLTLLSFVLCTAVTVTAQENSLTVDDAEVITKGFQFTEGPYWHKDGYLLFSDIPANTIYKWTPGTKDSEVYIKPSGHSNGITETVEGHLLLVQHDGLVSKVNDEKELVTLADSYKGQRLNSPNDATVASDGTIYFTDPPFGVSEEDKELTFSGVYKLTEGQEPVLLFDGFDRPNGVVLNKEESKVYVNNTTSGDIMVFERAEDGTFENGEQFANVGASSDTGAADGMVVDEEDRVYSTGPGGIFIFSSDGSQVEKIDLPARATNMEWGGEDLTTLFITTPSAVYRLPMKVKGVKK